MPTFNKFHSLGDLSQRDVQQDKVSLNPREAYCTEWKSNFCLPYWFLVMELLIHEHCVATIYISTDLKQVNSSTFLSMDIEIIGHRAYIIKIKCTAIAKLSGNEDSHILLGLDLNSGSLKQSCSEALRINTFKIRLSGKSHWLCQIKSQYEWQQVECQLQVF